MAMGKRTCPFQRMSPIGFPRLRHFTKPKMSSVEDVMPVTAGGTDDSQVEVGTGYRIGMSLGAPTSLFTPPLAISAGLHRACHPLDSLTLKLPQAVRGEPRHPLPQSKAPKRLTPAWLPAQLGSPVLGCQVSRYESKQASADLPTAHRASSNSPSRLH